MRAAAALVLLAAAAARAQAPSSEADLLRSLRDRAPAQALRAASEARAELSRHARVTATSVSLAARRESVSGSADGSVHVVGAGASFGLSRANAPAREAAREDAEAALAAADELLLDAACEVRSLASEIDALERRIRTLDGESARVAALREDAERRAAAGEEAPFEADVLRAEEAARSLPLPALRAAAVSARASLHAVTGRATGELRLLHGGEVPGEEAVAASAVAAHPRLRMLRARAEAARSRTAVARASNSARLDVFGGVRHESEPGASGDGHEVEVGVTLPARSLRRAAVSEAIVSERAIDLELALAEQAIRRSVAAAHASWRALEEAARGSEDAPPSLVEGALRRYRAGEGSLSEVLQVLALDRERLLSAIELDSARRAARLRLDCASAFVTAPDLLRVLEEARP